MNRGFIKSHKMAAGLIVTGFLFLVFSLAVTVRSFRREGPSITVSAREGREGPSITVSAGELTQRKKMAKEEKKVYSQIPDVERFKKYVGKKTEGFKKPIFTQLVIVAVDNKSQGEPPVVVNISPEATVTASSSIDNPYNVIDGNPETIWAATDPTIDPNPWIEQKWATPRIISSVTFRDRPDLLNQITGGQLLFSDGSSEPVVVLPNAGSPYTIGFAERTVTSVKFQITSTAPGTTFPGLAEMEVNCKITLCSNTIERVWEYCQDLASMGYRVILHPSKENSAQTLKEYIKSWYENPYQSTSPPDLVIPPTVETGPMWRVAGAVFIGDLPVPKTAYEPYKPIDLYFMDFDASWDISISGNIQSVSISSKDKLFPEIWVGRIPTHDLTTFSDKVYRINQYLSKVHIFREAVKLGNIPTGKALLYVDDSLSYKETPGLRLLFHPNRIEDRRIFRYPRDPTTYTDFLDRVSTQHERKYLWLDLAVSGDEDQIWFEERYVPDKFFPFTVTASKIRSSNGPLYCVLRGPGFCNYLVPNYIASGFIFGDNSSALICIGTIEEKEPIGAVEVTAGAALIEAFGSAPQIVDYFTEEINWVGISYEPFYSTLRIGNFGEAFKSLFKTVIQASDLTPTTITGKVDNFEFILLGDPTLLAYGKDNNLNPSYAFDYVAKGITGGDYSLPDLYVKGITVGYVPELGTNYIFYNLVYNDPSVIKVEFEEDGYLKASERETPQEISIPYRIYVDNISWDEGNNQIMIKKWKQFNICRSINPIGLDNQEHIIKVVLDPDSEISERDEYNNWLEETVHVGQTLDLIIQDMDFEREDRFYRVGKTWINSRNRFWVKIENKGSVPSEYLDENATFHLGLTIDGQFKNWLISKFYSDLTLGKAGALINFFPRQLIETNPDISSDLSNSTYEFVVELDSDDNIQEDGNGEDNNTKIENIQLPF